MQAPRNGISVSEQLDKAFFAKALQNGLYQQSIDIRRIDISAGSEDGDNHCSQIYRVRLIYDNEQLNPDLIFVIVKVVPTIGELNFHGAMNVFHKEKWLITDILPQFEILLDDIKFAPRCYYSTNTPLQTLVLEDMDRFGFQMANRVIGLDELHAKFSLKKLGQFHAVSMVFAKKRPSSMTFFNRCLIDPNAINPSTSVYKMLHKHLGYEIKLASEWEGFEEITKKLKEFYNDFESRVLACHKPRDGEIKVLNHGDFWVNNLLFKYDPRSNPVDLVFLDFQVSIYGSPGIDLNYFLFASVQLDVLKNWKTLLRVYHASLRDTLIKLAYNDIPTFEDVEREFKKNSSYGFFTLIGPLILMTMEKRLSEGNNFQNLAESDTNADAIFSSKKLIESLKYSLLELDKMGALDL